MKTGWRYRQYRVKIYLCTKFCLFRKPRAVYFTH